MTLKYCDVNPIIKPNNIKPLLEDFKILGTFNAAVERCNGKYYMLLRVAERFREKDKKVFIPIVKNQKIDKVEFDLDDEDYDFSDSRLVIGKSKRFLTSMSRILVLESEDGIKFNSTSRSILPDNEYEEFGIEDPRITKIDDIYYITYSAISTKGICTMLAKTKDFINIYKEGVIFCPDNKDVVLFPRKINDLYYAIHRPSKSEFSKPEMWIASSPDLKFWGNHKHLAGVRTNSWDSERIGAGAPPIEIDEGWLLIYHGATKDDVYSLGAMLLDKEKPEIVLKRTKTPILVPNMPYEKEGFVNNVVFSCGQIKKGDNLAIYYGAADETTALVEVSIKDILNAMEDTDE